jgi:protein-histidine pros-kinase
MAPPGAGETCGLLAAMGHDLRTPLNAIIGFTGTLLMELPGPLTADQQKHLRGVQAGGRLLLQMIDDLVDLAKIEAGSLPVRTEPVDCEALAAEVAAVLRPRAESRGLAFTMQNLLAPGSMLHSDSRLLGRILLALGENAVRGTERGSVRLILAGSQHPAGGQRMVEFRVQDTGAGIPPAGQAALFGGAPRLAADLARHGQGAGLGLLLGARLARLLGARIDLQCEAGNGCTYTVALPEAGA